METCCSCITDGNDDRSPVTVATTESRRPLLPAASQLLASTCVC